MESISQKGYKQLRKGRVSIPNAYYLITTATYKRKPVLTSDDVVQIIFDAFEWLEDNSRIRWQCIMVMPDHIHTVSQLQGQHTLQSILHSLKRFTSRQINILQMQTGRFWQDGYHDTGIRIRTDLNEMIRYCYENPVRKGIVKTAKEYPYWRCKYKME